MLFSSIINFQQPTSLKPAAALHTMQDWTMAKVCVCGCGCYERETIGRNLSICDKLFYSTSSINLPAC